jgi:hypothetical protein
VKFTVKFAVVKRQVQCLPQVISGFDLGFIAV